MLYGVDVSQHNGTVDFEELKNNGVQFVIVRSSYGCNELKERWRRQNSCAI